MYWTTPFRVRLSLFGPNGTQGTVVMTEREVGKVLGEMSGLYLLMGKLLYGGGCGSWSGATPRADLDFERVLYTLGLPKAKGRTTLSLRVFRTR